MNPKLQQDYEAAANRLHHLSMVYAGAMVELATGKPQQMIPSTYPGLRRTRDYLDLILLCRAEINAFTALAIKKGLFTEDELTIQCIDEYNYITECKEQLFDIKVTDYGIQLTPKNPSSN
jgi:hypothetical protein